MRLSSLPAAQARVIAVLLFVGAVSVACDRSDSSTYDDDKTTTPRATSTPTPTPPQNPSADNTGINERDRDGTTLTPGDQENNAGDLKLTQDIRQAITAEDGLSINARNIKIITLNGRVTLRGPVNSAAEHDRVLGIARRFADESNLDDQLEVAAP